RGAGVGRGRTRLDHVRVQRRDRRHRDPRRRGTLEAGAGNDDCLARDAPRRCSASRRHLCRAGATAVARRVPRHVVILGAGPAGLAAAVCLQRRGISYTVLERGVAPAAGLRRIDPEMEILSPTRLSLLPGMRRHAADPPYFTFPAYIKKLE